MSSTNDLSNKLDSRARVHHSAAILPPSPFGDQESRECLSRSSRELDRDIAGLLEASHVVAQHVSLVRPQTRRSALPAREHLEKLFRTIGDLFLRRVRFEDH